MGERGVFSRLQAERSSITRRPAFKSARDRLADQQAEARSFNVGAAGEALRDRSVEQVIEGGKTMLARLEAGGRTSGKDWDRAATMVAKGYDPQEVEEPLLHKVTGGLSWLDKLGASVRFGLADILGVDSAYNEEFGMEDFKDIWSGDWDSIKARRGEDLVGAEGRFGGSDMVTAITRGLEGKLEGLGLENLTPWGPEGWEPADEGWEGWGGFGWVNKLARFLPAASLEIGLDPLTYVTGGLGAASKAGAIKVSSTALKAASMDVLPAALSAVRKGVTTVGDEVAEGFLRRLGDDILGQAGDLTKALDELGEDAVMKTLGEAAEVVTKRELTNIGEAIATRDFGLLADDWVKYTKEAEKVYRSSGLRATTGGLRVGATPLGRGGITVPGTRGLGRKITRFTFGTAQDSAATRGFLYGKIKDPSKGTGIRGLIDRKTPLTRFHHSVVDAWGVENDMIRAFAGRSDTAVDMLNLPSVAKSMANDLGITRIANQLGDSFSNLEGVLRKQGVKRGSEDLDTLFRGMLDHTQGGRMMAADGFVHENETIQTAVREFAETFRNSMDELHSAAKAAGMELGHLENYVPAVRSEYLDDLFERFRTKRIAIPAKAPAGIDQRAYDLASEMVAAASRRGKGANRRIVGDAAYAHERTLGKTVRVRDMDATTIFELMEGTSVDFLDHTTMNDLLTTAFKRIADDNNIRLAGDFTALELNPVHIAEKYVSSMNKALVETTLAKAGRQLGLITKGTWDADAGRMAARLAENYENIGPKKIRELKTAADRLMSSVDELTENMERGAREAAWVGEKRVKERVGDSYIEVFESVANNRKVRHAIDQANRMFSRQGMKHGMAKENLEKAVKALKRQGMSDEQAEQVAKLEALEPIYKVIRAQESALLDKAGDEALGLGEITARLVAEGEEGQRAAQAMLRNQQIYNKERLQDAAKAARDSVERVAAHYKLGGPSSVARFDTPEAMAGFAGQLKPAMIDRLDLMADSIEQIKGGGPVAEEIRRLLDQLLDTPTAMTPDDLAKVMGQLTRTQELFEVMKGGGPRLRSYDEWVGDIPPLQRQIGTTEKEAVIKEWKESGIDVPDLPPPKVPGDAAIKQRNNEWFDAFEAMHGVDLRYTPKRYRNQLKQLLQPVPDTVDGTDAFEAVRRTILSTGQVRDMPKAAKESFKDIIVDIWRNTRAPKRGARRPPWGKFQEEELAAFGVMDSDRFFNQFGDQIADWVAEAGPDTPMWRVFEAYKHLWQGSNQVGKHVDTFLAHEVSADLALLDALANGKDVWRDTNMRNTLMRLFDESGMATEYRLVGAPGGKFQLQSKYEVTTLTRNQLQRELKLAGYDGSIEQAAKDIADETLQSSMLSQEALNTIGFLPTADRMALDSLHEAMDQSLAKVLGRQADKSQEVVDKAVEAAKLLNDLSKNLLKRGADGNITPGAADRVKAILFNRDYMRTLRQHLPVEEHARLDGLREMAEIQQMFRGMNPHVRKIVEANKVLRDELMYDPTKVKETIAATEDMIAAARQADELKDMQAEVEAGQKLLDVQKKLLGLAPGAEPTNLSKALLLGEDGAKEVESLLRQGERLADRLNWPDNPYKGIRSDMAVPTAATPGYTPAEHFGLGGMLVEGRLVEDNLGNFFEHTMKTMIETSTPAGLQAFSKGARQTMIWWKGLATVANLGFHTRNHLSASWNNVMADVRPGDYAFVTRWYGPLIRNYKDTHDWIAAARALPDPRASRIFSNAAEAGMFEATFAGSEALKLAATRGQANIMQKLNPLGKHGPLLYAGGLAMQGIEGYHRLAAFVRHFDYEKVVKYGDVEYERMMRDAANEWVNTVHFDYNSLTTYENRIRTIAPFFVWTRRNLPLQMRALVEQPRMIAAYAHLMGSANPDGRERYEDQIYADTGLMWNEGTEFWAKLILDVDLPVKDLFQISGTEADTAADVAFSPMTYLNLAANLLGPHLAEPAKALWSDDYATSTPVGFQTIWSQLSQDDQKMGQVPQMSNRLASLLRTLVPPIQQYGAAFNADPTVQQRMGILEGSDTELRDRLRATLFKVVGGGLGYDTAAVSEEYGLAAGSSFSTSEWYRDLKKSGFLTPEIVAEVDKSLGR